MIKSQKLLFAFVFIVTISLTSCYSHKSIVGAGAHKGIENSSWNHYLIAGLVPVYVSDSKDMAEGAIDYTIYTRHTFPNNLIALLTLGIWTPTTTTVIK